MAVRLKQPAALQKTLKERITKVCEDKWKTGKNAATLICFFAKTTNVLDKRSMVHPIHRDF